MRSGVVRPLASVTFLALCTAAGAEVLCSTRSAGTVKVRIACKARESPIDPVALDLQGPPGPPGTVAIAKDSTDALMGAVPNTGTPPDMVPQVILTTISVQGVSRPVVVSFGTSGFRTVRGRDPGVSFASPDCTGTPLLPVVDGELSPALLGEPFGPPTNPPADGNRATFVAGPDTVVYFATDVASNVFVQSQLAVRSQESCTPGLGVVSFTPPFSCCLGASISSTYAPAAAIDVGAFVPPFHIEVQ